MIGDEYHHNRVYDYELFETIPTTTIIPLEKTVGYTDTRVKTLNYVYITKLVYKSNNNGFCWGYIYAQWG